MRHPADVPDDGLLYCSACRKWRAWFEFDRAERKRFDRHCRRASCFTDRPKHFSRKRANTNALAQPRAHFAMTQRSTVAR